jgi:hypothetical protein
VRERRVLDLGHEGRHVLRLGMQEASRLALGRCVGEQVDGGELRLLGGGYKEQHGALLGVVDDRIVRGLAHGQQARGHVGDVEAVDVELEGHWAHIRMEVEDCC